MTQTDTTTSCGRSRLRRLDAPCQPQWQKFQQSIPNAKQQASQTTLREDDTTTHVYMRQYSHVYRSRLSLLGPSCQRHASMLYPSSSSSNIPWLPRILDLTSQRRGTQVLVLGTLVREKAGDISTTLQSIFDNDGKNKGDALVLEDASGRVQLEFQQQQQQQQNTNNHNNHYRVESFCTGLVFAVRAQILETGGVIAALELIPPMPLTIPSSLPSSSSSASPKVLLLSGLHCGSASQETSVARDLLLAYLEGALVSSSSQQIVRVILAGGNIAPNLMTTGNNNNNNNSNALMMVDAVRELDTFVSLLLSAGIPVDIIPGENDPTTHHWPQRPLHSSLFHTAASYHKLFHRTPNPYASEILLTTTTMDDDHDDHDDHHHKVVLWGTDGQNVRNLVQDQKLVCMNAGKQKEDQDDDDDDDDETRKTKTTITTTTNSSKTTTTTTMTEIQVLQQLLVWRHMCPSGPEHVPTIPHADERDPMVMMDEDEIMLTTTTTTTTLSSSSSSNESTTTTTMAPHIWFAGNCQTFDTMTMSSITNSSNNNSSNNNTSISTSNSGTTTTTMTSSIISNPPPPPPPPNHNRIRLLCIPSFATTGQACLVDLNTLDVELLQFEV